MNVTLVNHIIHQWWYFITSIWEQYSKLFYSTCNFSNALRILCGIGVFFSVFGSTNTWTNDPYALASSELLSNIPMSDYGYVIIVAQTTKQSFNHLNITMLDKKINKNKIYYTVLILNYKQQMYFSWVEQIIQHLLLLEKILHFYKYN